MLLGAILDCILSQEARRLLVRLTVLRRPWDWDLMRALAGPDLRDDQAAAAIAALRDSSLLTEVLEARASGGERLHFEAHPSVSAFVLEHTPDAPQLGAQAYRMAGDFLEGRAGPSSPLQDDIDAGHYLLEAGERDRAARLLGATSEYLQVRGLI